MYSFPADDVDSQYLGWIYYVLAMLAVNMCSLTSVDCVPIFSTYVFPTPTKYAPLLWPSDALS